MSCGSCRPSRCAIGFAASGSAWLTSSPRRCRSLPSTIPTTRAPSGRQTSGGGGRAGLYRARRCAGALRRDHRWNQRACRPHPSTPPPALAYGIAESQAFIDGNKRLALVSMLTFLEVNGYEVNPTDPEFADWIIGLSAGTTPEELAGRKYPADSPRVEEIVAVMRRAGERPAGMRFRGHREKVGRCPGPCWHRAQIDAVLHHDVLDRLNTIQAPTTASSPARTARSRPSGSPVRASRSSVARGTSGQRRRATADPGGAVPHPMELAGLEPATSWIGSSRSLRSPDDPITAAAWIAAA